jgi:hypothetical protein
MIIVLEFLPLLVYSCWIMRRAARARPAAKADQRSPHRATAMGLEDNPVHWPAGGAFWTALDERQLIRLLTDSAP